jgi:hypothetical protein
MLSRTRSFGLLWSLPGLVGVLSSGCTAPDDNEWNDDEPPVAESKDGIAGIRWPIGQQSAPGQANYLDPARCYHTPGSGAHKPGGGFNRADDLYALDINCQTGSEGGKPVYPVLSGKVRQVDSGLGFVLVEHSVPITVDGVAWARFFTGYMHMGSIPAGIAANASVTTNTQIGAVSSAGTSAIHLHFIAYVGSPSGEGGATTNGNLISFNPALLGGSFAPFDYVGPGYIWSRFVDNAQSSGAYQYVALGTQGDLFTSQTCGLRGSMRYTTSKSGAADNSFEFKVNQPTPVTGGYYFWPFVPRCNGTTASAPYAYRAGTSTTTGQQTVMSSFNVNQANLFDQYHRRAKVALPAGRYTTLTVTDASGEAGKKVAADQAILFRKTDHCLGGCTYAPASEQGYCLQSDYSTSTPSTSCPASSTVPAGY